MTDNYETRCRQCKEAVHIVQFRDNDGLCGPCLSEEGQVAHLAQFRNKEKQVTQEPPRNATESMVRELARRLREEGLAK